MMAMKAGAIGLEGQRGREKNFDWKLFSFMFTLCAVAFGSSFVIIPFMRKKFVEGYHWTKEKNDGLNGAHTGTAVLSLYFLGPGTA